MSLKFATNTGCGDNTAVALSINWVEMALGHPHCWALHAHH